MLPQFLLNLFFRHRLRIEKTAMMRSLTATDHGGRSVSCQRFPKVKRSWRLELFFFFWTSSDLLGMEIDLFMLFSLVLLKEERRLNCKRQERSNFKEQAIYIVWNRMMMYVVHWCFSWKIMFLVSKFLRRRVHSFFSHVSVAADLYRLLS